MVKIRSIQITCSIGYFLVKTEENRELEHVHFSYYQHSLAACNTLVREGLMPSPDPLWYAHFCLFSAYV